jgi:hypothetical protein
VTRGTHELVVVNMDIEFSNCALVEHSCGGADADWFVHLLPKFCLHFRSFFTYLFKAFSFHANKNSSFYASLVKAYDITQFDKISFTITTI